MPPENTENTPLHPSSQPPQQAGIDPQQTPPPQFPPVGIPQNTTPAPPPAKTFPTKKLIIGLVVSLILIGLVIAGFLIYQTFSKKGSSQESASNAVTEKNKDKTQNSTSALADNNGVAYYVWKEVDDYLAGTYSAGKTSIFKVSGGKKEEVFSQHGKYRYLSVSNDRNKILFLQDGPEYTISGMFVYDLSKNSMLSPKINDVIAQGSHLINCSFGINTKIICAASKDGKTSFYETSESDLKTLGSVDGKIFGIKFVANDNIYYLNRINYEDIIKVLNTSTSQSSTIINLGKTDILYLFYLKNTNKLIYGYYKENLDFNLFLYDLNAKTEEKISKVDNSLVQNLVLSQDESTLFFTSAKQGEFNNTRLFKLDLLSKKLQDIKKLDSNLNDLFLSPNKNALYFAEITNPNFSESEITSGTYTLKQLNIQTNAIENLYTIEKKPPFFLEKIF